MSEHLVVLITAGSQEEAERIAETLVMERLAACANVVPGVTSIYRWDGQIQHDQEWLLVVKSQQSTLNGLIERVQDLHSYDVPEVIALPVAGGSKAYLGWIDEEIPSR